MAWQPWRPWAGSQIQNKRAHCHPSRWACREVAKSLYNKHHGHGDRTGHSACNIQLALYLLLRNLGFRSNVFSNYDLNWGHSHHNQDLWLLWVSVGQQEPSWIFEANGAKNKTFTWNESGLSWSWVSKRCLVFRTERWEIKMDYCLLLFFSPAFSLHEQENQVRHKMVKNKPFL